MKQNRDLWVFIETDNGKALNSSVELFTPAREICGKTGGRICAVVLGRGAEAEAKLMGAYGADGAIAVEIADYSAAGYTDVMYKLINKYQPDALMLSATGNVKDFASRLACRLKTGITANCIKLDVDAESGLISWQMPAPGGIMATILCEKSRPQIGTVCPGVFKKPELSEGTDIQVICETVDYEDDKRLSLLESVRNTATGILSIADAEVIVAGGRGMGAKEGFELIEKLAEVLGAAVGASRAATNAEWIGTEHLVGQTGVVVHPRLYIACGISGALQHMVGVGADCVVAINNDPEAPIFSTADYALLGSAEKIIPVLIDEIQRLKA